MEGLNGAEERVWKRVASLDSLPPGAMCEFVDGETIYVVCNTTSGIRVTEGLCPHLAGPLAHGALHDHNVVCPWHAWEFDVRTGECDLNPAIKIETYAVEICGEEIFARLPQGA